jgi:hypothetical protein
MSDDDAMSQHEPVDEDSLGAILAKALVEVDALGGPDHARLAGVIGKDAFHMLNNRRSTRKALDAWLSATPQSKPAATRFLATAIARATEMPHLVDRIAREIDDSDVFTDPQPASMRASPMTDTRTKPASRPAPTKRSSDLTELAKAENISTYRAMRLRGQQRQRRHGV